MSSNLTRLASFYILNTGCVIVKYTKDDWNLAISAYIVDLLFIIAGLFVYQFSPFAGGFFYGIGMVLTLLTTSVILSDFV